MKLLITGGGTAGHINPALAIAQYFKEQDSKTEILYVGTPKGMEATLVKKAGLPFESVEVMGMYRSFSPKAIFHNVKATKAYITAKPKAKKIIEKFKPDLVIGTGGYVSEPILEQATKMGCRTAIHEQNAIPGITNRALSKKVDKVFLAFDEARKYLYDKMDYTVVGNPVREALLNKSKTQARAELGIPDDKICILSFGGSLGADTINKIAVDIMDWHKDRKDIVHIHGYGRLGKEKFPALLKEHNLNLNNMPQVRATEYIYDMDTCLAAADLLISRAGALTLSEIEATGKAALLIPSPNVTANHQFHNAKVLKNKNAALLLEEKDYTPQKAVEIVSELCNNKEKLSKLSENAKKLAVTDTAKRIYDELMK